MEITILCPCVKSIKKVSNKTVDVIVTDTHKNVRRRGTTKFVGIAAEICPKIVVEILEAL